MNGQILTKVLKHKIREVINNAMYFNWDLAKIFKVDRRKLRVHNPLTDNAILVSSIYINGISADYFHGSSVSPAKV